MDVGGSRGIDHSMHANGDDGGVDKGEGGEVDGGGEGGVVPVVNPFNAVTPAGGDAAENVDMGDWDDDLRLADSPWSSYGSSHTPSGGDASNDGEKAKTTITIAKTKTIAEAQ